MQATVSRGCQGLKPLSARRSAVRTPAFGSTTSRRTSVQVFAAKGRSKGGARQGAVPGQTEMVRREAPVPEVDPENAEIVMFFRCLKYRDPVLNADVGPSMWVPLTILKGNQVMNFLVGAVKNDWGMKLYGRTLIWQIASSFYQEKAKVEKDIRKNFPPFAKASSNDLQFAFKIRDKANPKDWTKAEGLTIFPNQDELGSTGPEALKKFFSVENFASMFKAPEGASTPAQQQ